jgi:uncharacterized OB-fold protein
MFADDAETHAAPAAPSRWLCHCSTPPILLGMVEGGNVNLKMRDRYYHIEAERGQIRAICPKCGRQHRLEFGRVGGVGEVGRVGE